MEEGKYDSQCGRPISYSSENLCDVLADLLTGFEDLFQILAKCESAEVARLGAGLLVIVKGNIQELADLITAAIGNLKVDVERKSIGTFFPVYLGVSLEASEEKTFPALRWPGWRGVP